MQIYMLDQLYEPEIGKRGKIPGKRLVYLYQLHIRKSAITHLVNASR
jgi:hypothetical protein